MTDTLYVLHQGYGGDGALWCATWDGTTWEDKALGAGITGGPAVAVYKGVVHVFRRGSGDNANTLMHMKFENGDWSADESLGAGLTFNPAAVVYDDKLWVFHQDGAGSGAMYYMTYDGESWTADTQLPLGMSFSPGAAVYDDKLWVFHSGYEGRSIDGSDHRLWYITYDGSSWSDDTSLLTYAWGSPSLAAQGNNLFLFYEQYYGGASGLLGGQRYDGTNWNIYYTLPCRISQTPAVVSFNGSVYVFHQGYNEDGSLWYIRWNGSTWDADVMCPPLMSDSPGVAVLPS